jgi:hypothetical protein
MGLNAQTSVPAFTTGQVLTAQQQTDINTGIPVFATTVTRDAAFGGTGEKVLAQGQYAFIEATNQTQFYNGSAWLTLGGKIGQVIEATTSTAVSTTSTTFVTTGLTATITPVATTSKVLVMVSCVLGTDGSVFSGQVSALFRGTVAGTNIAQMLTFTSSNSGTSQNMMKLDSPSTTSAQVYTLGIKTNSASTVIYANRENSFGSIILMEVLA